MEGSQYPSGTVTIDIACERYAAFVQTLKRMGEVQVRIELESELGSWDADDRRRVKEWLFARDVAHTLAQERRADETLRIAERSAVASEKSARFAMWSSIIALATVAVTVLMGGFLARLFGSTS